MSQPAPPTSRTLGDQLHSIWRHRWLLVGGALVGTVGGGAWSLTQPASFRSSTTVVIDVYRTPSLFGGTPQNGADARRRLLNEIEFVTSDTVRERVQEQLDLASLPPRPVGASSATSDVVRFTLTTPNAQRSVSVLNSYIAAYNDVKAELAAELPDAPDNLTAAVVIQPASSAVDISASPLRSSAFGLIIGTAVASLALMAKRRFASTIDTPDDLATAGVSLPVLAIIPTHTPTAGLPVALASPSDRSIEGFRWLRASVQFASTDRPMKIVQVTSAEPGEGKTTTALNLAVVLGQSGASVVLVDADLRRPRVGSAFDITSSVGLSEILSGAPIADGIQHATGFDVVPAGHSTRHPSEALSGPQLARVLTGLAEQYDHVIVDSSPVLPVTDARAIARVVDGVLMVVRSGSTNTLAATRAIDELRRIDAPLLGVVLNGFDATHSRYGYGAYDPD